MRSSTERDNDVRLHIYERFLADGRPPSHEETAAALGVSDEEAADAYRRLAEQHVVVLDPGSLSIWMANPLSAHPTPYRVETPRGGYFGNCIWDAFGLVAMLGGNGTVTTSCPDCGETMELGVADGELGPAEGVAHFAVPARRWWDDIGYT